MAPEFISQSKDHVAVKGDLTFYTVTSLCEKMADVFQPAATITVDLAQVQSCDSASLVLMLSIIEQCRTAQSQVKFSHIPEAINTLIALYHLQTIIQSAE